MKLISWNVNGIRAAVKKGFLQYLEQENPDILCVQETKAQREQLTSELLKDHGYYTFWHSGDRKGYSGVATFCKHQPLYVQEGLGLEKYDKEGRVLITEHDNFLLYNIYFPNGQKNDERLRYKLDFYDDLLPIINDQVNSGNNVIVAGDWNTAHLPIDLARPRENENTSGFLRVERDWMDNLQASGFIDTFRYFNPDSVKYSWWTYMRNARANNAGWRIDYFWTNNIKIISNAGIHNDVHGSDHCPVSVNIKL